MSRQIQPIANSNLAVEQFYQQRDQARIAALNLAVERQNALVSQLMPIIVEGAALKQAIASLIMLNPTAELAATEARRIYALIGKVLIDVRQFYILTGGVTAELNAHTAVYGRYMAALEAAYTPIDAYHLGDGGKALRDLVQETGGQDLDSVLNSLTARGNSVQPGTKWIVKTARSIKATTHRSWQAAANYMIAELTAKEQAGKLSVEESAALDQIRTWGNPRSALNRVVNRHKNDFQS